MEKRYQEIIELEKLDELIGWDHKLVIAVQLYLLQTLECKKELIPDYHFTVIEYGFQGYYPVIGVQHLKRNSGAIEDFVIKEYDTLVKSVSLDDLIQFVIQNKNTILKILFNSQMKVE